MVRRGIEGEPQRLDPNEQPEAQSEKWIEIRAGITELWQHLPPKEQATIAVDLILTVLRGELGEEVRQQLNITEIVEPKNIDGELLPYTYVAEQTGYSTGRLRALLKEGRIPGVMRKSRPAWYTSIEEVEKYRTQKPDSQEIGRKGAHKRWHNDT